MTNPTEQPETMEAVTQAAQSLFRAVYPHASWDDVVPELRDGFRRAAYAAATPHDAAERTRKAAKPFVSHYDPSWMDEKADDALMWVAARVTYGELRALRSAIAEGHAAQRLAAARATVAAKADPRVMDEILGGEWDDHPKVIAALEVLTTNAPVNAPDDAVERVARAISKPLANMNGGCFKPDNGRSDRGDCADGDCYCTRVSKHCARAALATLTTNAPEATDAAKRKGEA